MSKYVELKLLFKILGERGYLNIETGFEEEVLNELEQSLPTIEVSEDCISRDYILSEAFASGEYNRETKSFDLPVVSVRDVENAPSVVPCRAEGEWLHLTGSVYRCSNCDEYTKSSKPFEKPKCNYCPNCGAKMKGVSDD